MIKKFINWILTNIPEFKETATFQYNQWIYGCISDPSSATYNIFAPWINVPLDKTSLKYLTKIKKQCSPEERKKASKLWKWLDEVSPRLKKGELLTFNYD